MARAAFCHVELPRTEERIAPGELRAHTVYLVRLESHLGKYPSPDTWFELRYSRFQHLHQKLRETHPTLRLPELPRSRPRWLNTHHPEYVHKLAEELRRYLRRLLAFWIQAYGGFDSFIVLLHALGTNDELPPPPQKVDDGESPLASLGPGSLSAALAGASALSAADGEADDTPHVRPIRSKACILLERSRLGDARAELEQPLDMLLVLAPAQRLVQRRVVHLGQRRGAVRR